MPGQVKNAAIADHRCTWGAVLAAAVLGGICAIAAPAASRADVQPGGVESLHGRLLPRFDRGARSQRWRADAVSSLSAEESDSHSAPFRPSGTLPRPLLVPAGAPIEPRQPLPPGDPARFAVWADNSLGPDTIPGGAGLITEPSIANRGDLLFLTGNWFAAFSHDGGQTFTMMDPFSEPFPAADRGFCCDQNVLYEPSRDVLFWVQMFSPDDNGNTVRINIDHGVDGVFECEFSVTVPALQLPAGQYLDMPDLVVSDNFLYVTTNAFKIEDGQFLNSVIVRLPLDQMANCGSVDFDSYTARDRFAFKAVQGAGHTMYWGAHQYNFPPLFPSSVRIYRWDEDSPMVFFDDRLIAPWNPLQPHCPGPDGKDWCGRADDRISAAYVAGGVIGFLWSSAEGDGFPFPYVQMVRFRESDRELIDEPQIYSTQGGYLYPSVSPNARGDLGGTMMFGGGGSFPSCVAWLADTVSGGGIESYIVANGTAGPDDNTWGDYLTTRSHVPFSNTWIGTCETLDGGGGRSNVRTHALWFGREQDAPLVATPPTETPTPSSTPTPVPEVPTSTPTPTPTPTPAPTSRSGLCIGDCNGDDSVGIDELIMGVSIALGVVRLDVCPVFDANADGEVTVEELLAAVDEALNGCPATPTPSVPRCGNGITEADEQCDDGNMVGGDGCAANCTLERPVRFDLDPVGTQVHIETLGTAFTVGLRGGLTIIGGAFRNNDVLDVHGTLLFRAGEIPVVAKVTDIEFQPMQLPSLGCACLRPIEEPQFGAGNAAAGVVACGDGGLVDTDYTFSIDHNTNDVDPDCNSGSLDVRHPGVCNGPPVLTLSGAGPRGAAVLKSRISIAVIFDGGTCATDKSDPLKGADGIPCTADDLAPGLPMELIATTGTAMTFVQDANNQPGVILGSDTLCGAVPCPLTRTGRPFDCESILDPNSSTIRGGALVAEFALLDASVLGDALTATTFVAACPGACECDTTLTTPCVLGRFCEANQDGCGADSMGSCTPIPISCPALLAPVCGCDGVTYENDCLRRMNAVGRDHQGPC